MTTATTTAGTVQSADGTTIAFEARGHGPALVLVDGACCFRESGPLRSLAQHLAGEFTVTTYDRRGRGESTDIGPYAVEREVEDLAALVAAAEGPVVAYAVSSGALLAMRAVAAGIPIGKLALFEPPIGEEGRPTAESDFTRELRALVEAGRRGDAVEHFQVSIGVPADMVAGMRQTPMWAALESIAPTLVYDSTLADTTSLSVARSVPVPTMVIDSGGSSDDLTGWAADLVAALPNGTRRSLDGQWHMVADEVMAPALTGFFRS